MLSTIRHFENRQYALPAYVVMDDHVHGLLLPFDGIELHSIIHSWKSFAAKRLARERERTPPIWQREYFDRIVRDDDEFRQKAEYILNNPVKRWPSMQEYAWVGFGSDW